jgi:Ca-activated chloride channel family protein
MRRNDEINNLLREADIQFYAINIPKEKKDRLQIWLMKEGQETLKKLANISGGKAFFPNNIKELGSVAHTINNEIRHQYSIGFTPNGNLDGRWHKLKVKIKGDIYNQFVIRSRAGYIARHTLKD